MPEWWEAAPLVEPKTPPPGANWWDAAPLVKAKQEPTFGSRLYDSTIGPVVEFGKRASEKAQRMDPRAAVGETVVETLKGIADRYKAQPSNNIPARLLGTVLPIDEVAEDIQEGRPGAAMGTVAGVGAMAALPKLPGALSAVSKTKAALVTKGAIGGGARGAIEALVDSSGSPITPVDVLIPGAKKAKLAASAGVGAYRGAKAGASEARSAYAAAEHRAANPAQAPESIPPQAAADASPIPGELPSGRKPPTREQTAARADSPSTRNPIGPVAAVTQELLEGIAKDQTGQKFSNMSPARQKLVRAIAAKVAKAPEAAEAKASTAPANPTVAAEDFGTLQGVDAEGMAVYGAPGAVERANAAGRSPMQDFLLRKEQEMRARKGTPGEIERAVAPDAPAQAKAPAIEADSPLSRLSPEKQAEAQVLKDLMGDTGPSPDAPARQFEAGARAKKVWNMSDLLSEHGISAQDAALMTDEMWNQATEAINLANKADWAASKGAGKPPQRHHLPGAQSRAQIIKELQDIEARKANPQ